jgi:hypothetical protein
MFRPRVGSSFATNTDASHFKAALKDIVGRQLTYAALHSPQSVPQELEPDNRWIV